MGAQKQAANKWLSSTFSSSMETPEEALAALGACHQKHNKPVHDRFGG